MYLNPEPYRPHIPEATPGSQYPANPHQLAQPQLGEVIHPSDISGAEQAQMDLPPPVSAGAEQDMQAQRLEHHLGARATSGAHETPENPETTGQPDQNAPEVSSSPPAASDGGAQPPGPPKPPVPSAESPSPDDGPRPTPRLDVLGEHQPSKNEAALAVAIQSAALRKATSKFADYVHKTPQADAALRLRANTSNGYVDFLTHDGKLTVNAETFAANGAGITRDLEDNLEPNQAYAYTETDKVDVDDITRTPADQARHRVALFPDELAPAPEAEQESSPTTLGTAEAIAILELLATAEPAPVSLTEIKKIMEQREYGLYEPLADNQEAAAAARLLATIVTQAAIAANSAILDYPMHTTEIRTTQYIGWEEGLGSDAFARTSISLGWEEAEPLSLQAMDELDEPFYIPDTLEALDKPTMTPRVKIEATSPMPPDDIPYWRTILFVLGFNTHTATLEEGVQYTARVDEGKLMIEMTKTILLDGETVHEEGQINGEGTIGDVVRLQHYLRQPHYISDQVNRAWEYNHQL
jgi:hypothetical protein